MEDSGTGLCHRGQRSCSLTRDTFQYCTPGPFSEVITTKGTISIIFNDETRLARTDIFLLILLDEMNRVGFKDRRISPVIFDGTHCLMPW